METNYPTSIDSSESLYSGSVDNWSAYLTEDLAIDQISYMKLNDTTGLPVSGALSPSGSNHEVIYYVGVDADKVNNLVRSINGKAASAYLSSTVVYLLVHADIINTHADAIYNIENQLDLVSGTVKTLSGSTNVLSGSTYTLSGSTNIISSTLLIVSGAAATPTDLSDYFKLSGRAGTANYVNSNIYPVDDISSISGSIGNNTNRWNNVTARNIHGRISGSVGNPLIGAGLFEHIGTNVETAGIIASTITINNSGSTNIGEEISNLSIEENYSTTTNSSGRITLVKSILREFPTLIGDSTVKINARDYFFNEYGRSFIDVYDGANNYTSGMYDIFDTHICGATRNRYCGIKSATNSANNPDTISVTFFDTLPDNNYNIQLTGRSAYYNVPNIMLMIGGGPVAFNNGLYINTSWHVTSKTVNGFSAMAQHSIIMSQTLYEPGNATTEYNPHIGMNVLSLYTNYSASAVEANLDSNYWCDWSIRRYY